MRDPRRLVAVLAAILILLSPPVVATAMAAAHHGHAPVEGGPVESGPVESGHGRHAEHRHDDADAGPGVADDGFAARSCLSACAALQVLPAIVAGPSFAGPGSPPDTTVHRSPGRLPAPEPPPPRAL